MSITPKQYQKQFFSHQNNIQDIYEKRLCIIKQHINHPWELYF